MNNGTNSNAGDKKDKKKLKLPFPSYVGKAASHLVNCINSIILPLVP
jgi:hypothetical protein